MERNWQEVRKDVKRFVENEVYPLEPVLQKKGDESSKAMTGLMQKAKDQSLWGAWTSKGYWRTRHAIYGVCLH